MGVEKKSYYKEKLPDLVSRLKKSADQLLSIIDKKIDDELADDKLHNALKAKRMASEDLIWTLKRVDELEDEINGVQKTQEELDKKEADGLHPSKRFAKNKG